VLEAHRDGIGGGLALADGRILSWRRDGALRLWSGEGDRIDVWASPNGSITSVVPLKNARGSVAMLVGRHVYFLQIGA
jgi:hypothetical protein